MLLQSIQLMLGSLSAKVRRQLEGGNEDQDKKKISEGAQKEANETYFAKKHTTDGFSNKSKDSFINQSNFLTVQGDQEKSPFQVPKKSLLAPCVLFIAGLIC